MLRIVLACTLMILAARSSGAAELIAASPFNDFEAVCSRTSLEVQLISPSTRRYEDGDLNDTVDCGLVSGMAVRLRWGNDQAFPYGECGGAPPEYVSLWMDKRRLLSRYFIGDGCRGLRVRSITVGADAIEICIYIPQDVDSHRDIDHENAADFIRGPFGKAADADFHHKCASTIIDRSMPIDDIEYPADPQSIPKAGSLKLLVQADPEICAASVSPDRLHIIVPANAMPIAWREWTAPKYCGQTQRATFDFANDGVDRDVYDWNLCTHAQDGDTYVTLPMGAPEPAIGVGEYDGERLSPPSGARMWDLGYWHGQVFRLKDTTYVLATPVNEEEDLYLWRPQSNGSMQTICSWQRVKRHF